jgi:acyl carrier protein
VETSVEHIRTRVSAVSGLPLARLGDEMKIRDLALDSFAIVELLVDLQEEFKIRLGQEDVAKITTVGDLVSIVAARTAA